MSATKTSTMPITEMPRAAVEEALADVRRQLGDLQHSAYSSPDLSRGDTEQAQAYWAETRTLTDREALFVRRLRVLDRRQAQEEQAAERQPEPGAVAAIALPSGINPAFIGLDLQRRYQDAVLSDAEKKPGAAGRLAKIEQQLVEVDAEARRVAAAQLAKVRRDADEAEARRKVEEGQREKARIDAEAKLETARMALLKADTAWAQAAAEYCRLGAEARNVALHDQAAAGLCRAVQTLVPMPWSKRLITALGDGWRTTTRSRRIV